MEFIGAFHPGLVLWFFFFSRPVLYFPTSYSGHMHYCYLQLLLEFLSAECSISDQCIYIIFTCFVFIAQPLYFLAAALLLWTLIPQDYLIWYKHQGIYISQVCKPFVIFIPFVESFIQTGSKQLRWHGISHCLTFLLIFICLFSAFHCRASSGQLITDVSSSKFPVPNQDASNTYFIGSYKKITTNRFAWVRKAVI